MFERLQICSKRLSNEVINIFNPEDCRKILDRNPGVYFALVSQDEECYPALIQRIEGEGFLVRFYHNGKANDKEADFYNETGEYVGTRRVPFLHCRA